VELLLTLYRLPRLPPTFGSTNASHRWVLLVPAGPPARLRHGRPNCHLAVSHCLVSCCPCSPCASFLPPGSFLFSACLPFAPCPPCSLLVSFRVFTSQQAQSQLPHIFGLLRAALLRQLDAALEAARAVGGACVPLLPAEQVRNVAAEPAACGGASCLP
jgi:hypothetical protein